MKQFYPPPRHTSTEQDAVLEKLGKDAKVVKLKSHQLIIINTTIISTIIITIVIIIILIIKVVRLNDHQFLMPGLIDTHIHASQFPNAGLALDLTLLDWLER